MINPNKQSWEFHDFATIISFHLRLVSYALREILDSLMLFGVCDLRKALWFKLDKKKTKYQKKKEKHTVICVTQV